MNKEIFDIFDIEMKETNNEKENELAFSNLNIIDILNEMIKMKKENNYLKKRIKFLENLLRNYLNKKSIDDYIKNDLLNECNEKQNILLNLIPDQNLEVIYHVGDITGKRKKYNRKNNNNNQEKKQTKKKKKKNDKI
jgi:hypothetical protein